MIQQFKVIGSVKKVREEKALRALEAARATLQKAIERADALSAQADESTRTLPARENAIYDEIINQVVDMSDVDGAKGRVQQLLEDHQRLLDRRDRAKEHVQRCEEKVAEARVELRRRQADVEKIETITEELVIEAEAEATAKEETEIEDLFAKPTRQPDAGLQGETV